MLYLNAVISQWHKWLRFSNSSVPCVAYSTMATRWQNGIAQVSPPLLWVCFWGVMHSLYLTWITMTALLWFPLCLDGPRKRSQGKPKCLMPIPDTQLQGDSEPCALGSPIYPASPPPPNPALSRGSRWIHGNPGAGSWCDLDLIDLSSALAPLC